MSNEQDDQTDYKSSITLLKYRTSEIFTNMNIVMNPGWGSQFSKQQSPFFRKVDDPFSKTTWNLSSETLVGWKCF